MCDNDSDSTKAHQTFEVTLDGELQRIPLERKSLGAIRCYLETLALAQHRVISSLKIDGKPADHARFTGEEISFRHIDAETTEITNRPSQILGTALDQVINARNMVEVAVTQVLINEGPLSREIWWDLARKLKEPLQLLGLLPESTNWQTQGCASLRQIRKWQLEQLAVILKDVDAACWGTDMTLLSNALENRALPWLNDLERTVTLWHQTTLAGDRLRVAEQDWNCPVLEHA